MRRLTARRRPARSLYAFRLWLLVALSLLIPPQAARAQEAPDGAAGSDAAGQVFLPFVWQREGELADQEPLPLDPGDFARVVGATAPSSMRVRVLFSKPMSRSAIDVSNYAIAHEAPDGQVSHLTLFDAWFTDGEQTTVEISTTVQSNVLYKLTAATVLDMWGKPMGPKEVVGGVLVDPTAATFAGRAPGNETLPPNPLEPTRIVGVISLSNTTVRLAYNNKMGDDAIDPAKYSITGVDAEGAPVNLGVSGASFDDETRTTLTLTTTAQSALTYKLSALGVRDFWGEPLGLPQLIGGVLVDPASASFVGIPASDALPPKPSFATRIVSAISISNTAVLVTYNKPMGDSAAVPSNYSITADNGGGAPSYVVVTGAAFADATRMVVQLTTLAQSDRVYKLAAGAVFDQWGDPLGPKEIIAGVVVDPSSANFAGTPLSGPGADGDGDLLSDATEQLGYPITVYLADGKTVARHVTSDPSNPDTDGDGIDDFNEKAYNADPRAPDTDGDQLTDFRELNHIYSDPARQDSDGDAYMDGLEFDFFKTSPIFDDTDGDQIKDGDEIAAGNRNPRVADLPKPAIEVGDISLRLDVRFTEETATETRELETRSVESTLTQSQRKEFSNSNSNTQEASAKLTVGTEYEVSAKIFDPGGTFTSKIEAEAGWTGSWTSESTSTSESQTEQAYQESLGTEAEKTRGSTVNREVAGARMQATVFLKNASNLAYTVKNLQVTVFIQDPQDPTRLTPVATLLPDNEPEEGFTLGPLVPERGPFIFSNDTIFPNLVDSLMQNPRGLTFSISNFDITDELGRNFAFSSQEVIERTASLVIDRGSYDSDGDGEGDLTEYHRVATATGRLIDTNGDGVIDENDQRAIFGPDGKPVGITLADALDALGLAQFVIEDPTRPITETISPDQLPASYSIARITGTEVPTPTVRDAIFSIGATTRKEDQPKAWEVLTPNGIDQTRTLEQYILTAEGDLKLAFVQDLDGDRLPANLEFVNNCSDILADTDGDGINDLDETLIGWQVETGRGSIKVFSRCSLPDSDRDGLTDGEEAGKSVPSCGGTPAAEPKITDPASRDTDGDGVFDRDELCGYNITKRDGTVIFRTTDPTNPDTDGDTGPDGVERELGGDPRDIGDRNDYADDDGDGLVNFVETAGWDIGVTAISNMPLLCNIVCNEGPLDFGRSGRVTSDPANPDTDGDGIRDGEENRLGTNPRQADSDGDGLTDFQETRGFALSNLPDAGIILTNPRDADSDNDKRSDGAEAELNNTNEATFWIVRAEGKAPERVFSHPLVADADYDALADGDEFAAGSHPRNANTDGDRRNDRLDVQLGLNPLVEDFRVTVQYPSLYISSNDNGAGANDIEFAFQVQRPDVTQPSGLGSPVNVAWDADPLLGIGRNTGWLRACTTDSGGNTAPTPCWDFPGGDGYYLLQISGGQTLSIPAEFGSISFSMTRNQRFSILGLVSERGADSGGLFWRTHFFGGLDGIRAKIDGTDTLAVFDGAKVADQTIVQMTFDLPSYPTGQVRVRYFVD